MTRFVIIQSMNSSFYYERTLFEFFSRRLIWIVFIFRIDFLLSFHFIYEKEVHIFFKKCCPSYSHSFLISFYLDFGFEEKPFYYPSFKAKASSELSFDEWKCPSNKRPMVEYLNECLIIVLTRNMINVMIKFTNCERRYTFWSASATNFINLWDGLPVPTALGTIIHLRVLM